MADKSPIEEQVANACWQAMWIDDSRIFFVRIWRVIYFEI